MEGGVQRRLGLLLCAVPDERKALVEGGNDALFARLLAGYVWWTVDHCLTDRPPVEGLHVSTHEWPWT